MYKSIKYQYSILILILFHSYGYSYIDPGSLSAIWQFLAAIIIGLLSGFSFIRIKIIDFFNFIFKKIIKNNKKS